MLEAYLPEVELTLFHRMGLIWLFIIAGLVVALQVSQSWAEPRPQWTVIDQHSRPYWMTYYVFVAFLFMQITYRPLLFNLDGLLGGLEVEILDALWIGLLGLEAVMLAWVFVLRIAAITGNSSATGRKKVKEL
ncbi:hypothetical protein BX600DRAFT_461955 [Xylariales sp. PMI_506]|nr:hypothetical protein BX600DRAFT_461955 [Xylariales sp. PMI_506]